VEAGLLRIAQEALNNALQHANATRIDLGLSLSAEQVQLMIHDDGCGFDPQNIGTSRHGLVGITERPRLLTADLSIEIQLNEGTRVTVTLVATRGNDA
jgi:two-component system NarL family sensor kinase